MKLTGFTLHSMLMYHLTQEVIIKFFEISILSTFDHNNFKCGFSQNFNVFDKIHIWDYDDQEVNKNQYFQNLSLCPLLLKLFWVFNTPQGPCEKTSVTGLQS